MRRGMVLWGVLGLGALVGCDEEEEEEAVCEAPEQGVSGAVLWKEGNHMPGDTISGTSEALVTTVAAFPVITEAIEDTSKSESYGRYDFEEAEAVATTTSDADGCYSLALDAGSYTIAADDDGAWFCNSFSAEGLCIVVVEESVASEFNIDIDYRASY